jgi:hypothetical protein
MRLITTFVELRVIAGRSRTRAGSPQAVFRWPRCAVALRRTAWSEHSMGMASVNQTRPHCVNQIGKTHSKPLAARHGRGTAWTQHGRGMLCVNRPLGVVVLSQTEARNLYVLQDFRTCSGTPSPASYSMVFFPPRRNSL